MNSIKKIKILISLIAFISLTGCILGTAATIATTTASVGTKAIGTTAKIGIKATKTITDVATDTVSTVSKTVTGNQKKDEEKSSKKTNAEKEKH